jgi:hypothetical protein
MSLPGTWQWIKEGVPWEEYWGAFVTHTPSDANFSSKQWTLLWVAHRARLSSKPRGGREIYKKVEALANTMPSCWIAPPASERQPGQADESAELQSSLFQISSE